MELRKTKNEIIYNLINKVFNYLNEGNELTNNYLNNLQKAGHLSG